MKQKLVIELSEIATENYLKWARDKVTAHVDADVEPCGVTISISIGPTHYGSDAYVHDGDDFIDFGEAKVNLVETASVSI